MTRSVRRAVEHHRAGRRDEAAKVYRHVLTQEPAHADALNLLGAVAHQAKDHNGATALMRRALRVRPHPEYASNFGLALSALGRHADALAPLRAAIAERPDYVEAYSNLGNALEALGRFDAALADYRRAVRLDPHNADVAQNLGVAQQGRMNFAAAAAAFRHALVLRPDAAETLAQLAHQSQHMCDWAGLEAMSRRVRHLVGAGAPRVPPFVMLTLGSSAAEQLACASSAAAQVARATALPPRPAAARADGRIRLGYLSADFHQHATAFLIAELFERHDRRRFHVTGYSYGPDDASPMRRRLTGAFDRFVDLAALPHAAAARRIRDDGIDILIDLKGYTQHARPAILAHRPAPIQVNYLGYPGTLGADFADYILVDRHIVPPDQQPFYAERLVHLPHCYQVNDTRRPIAATIAGQPPTRTACGLPGAGFVFCCFNNSYKITPAVFAAWMRLLAAVPGSVLWLLEANAAVTGNLRAAAAAHGVDPQRLVFAPWAPLPEHLARYALADLFLDTLPVNAHTTASDALWAGLPVLTCMGETFVARVAGSLLHAVGLPELVTGSLAAYEAQALRLAQRPDELAALRARLAANRATAPLFDTAGFTRHLEAAYQTMWRIHAAGEPPRPFAVQPAETRPVPDVQQAMQAHQQGRRDEAARLYRRILAEDPANGDALHLYGVVAYQDGDFTTAARRITDALRVRERTEYLTNLGLALTALGRPEDAVAAFGRAIALYPDNAEANNNLGIALKKRDEPLPAAAAYRRALALRPDYPEAWFNLGLTTKQLGLAEQAIAAYDRAIALHAGYAEAHNNRAVALKDLGRPDEAGAAYARSIALLPTYAQAHSNHGILLKDLGRVAAAAAAHRRAIALCPDLADGYNNLGNTLIGEPDLTDTIAAYRRTLRLDPMFAEAYFNLGVAMHTLRRPAAAAACFKGALACRPDYVDALGQLVHQSQYSADWTHYVAQERRLRAMLATGKGQVAPFVMLTLDSSAAEQLACASSAAAQVARATALPPRPAAARADGRIRLGYLSADF
ncbi:tetratricopeptide repeat protein, partial [Azospirillum sp.]|uniref:O-linked N-acetylglucosamine transferase family protein n=1 Tax=Azospirillum sp. TaxID=34012 RepID=UPI002D424C9C